MQATTCLHSTVRNASGGRKTFSFLPPHGRALDANEELTVFGNITEAIITGVDRGEGMRNVRAFERAVGRNLLEIVHTTTPILESPGGNIKMLHLADNGTLSSVDPCWGLPGGSSDSLIV